MYFSEWIKKNNMAKRGIGFEGGTCIPPAHEHTVLPQEPRTSRPKTSPPLSSCVPPEYRVDLDDGGRVGQCASSWATRSQAAPSALTPLAGSSASRSTTCIPQISSTEDWRLQQPVRRSFVIMVLVSHVYSCRSLSTHTQSQAQARSCRRARRDCRISLSRASTLMLDMNDAAMNGGWYTVPHAQYKKSVRETSSGTRRWRHGQVDLHDAGRADARGGQEKKEHTVNVDRKRIVNGGSPSWVVAWTIQNGQRIKLVQCSWRLRCASHSRVVHVCACWWTFQVQLGVQL